jgi:hypothetical protein
LETFLPIGPAPVLSACNGVWIWASAYFGLRTDLAIPGIEEEAASAFRAGLR